MVATGVKVAVRCRPMSKREEQLGSKTCLEILPEKAQVKIMDLKNENDDPKLFTFDHAYGSESVQPQVYTDLGSPLLERALDGINGTIFAYGQTGSGKTWTMMGIESDPGLIPQLNMDLFKRADEIKQGESKEGGDCTVTVDFMLTASYIEIYNEVIMDLLNPGGKKLDIRESPEKGVYVQGVCEVVCQSSSDIMKLVKQGGAVRRVAATQMNQESSRSHSCFTIKMEKRTLEKTDEKTKTTMLTSKINLVDLAGSERASKTGATGSTLKEGAAINKSLMALGTVINALGEIAKGKSVHIPYRDSKLTRLLQESLGGNSSTLMIAALSPADYNHSETLGTLNYAKRVKLVENKVEKNEDVKEKEIRQLKEEIEALRAQLQKGGSVGGSGGAIVDSEETARKIKELEEGKNLEWEEKQRLSRELEEERAKNMNVAIGSVIDGVKEEKMKAMKRIKKLQHDKKKNDEKSKKVKDLYHTLKSDLEGGMSKYKEMQVVFDGLGDGDEKDSVEEKMAELLDSVERKRTKLIEAKAALSELKKKNEKIDEELIEVRAELVTVAGVLSQNDDLRKKIEEEERAKFDALKDELLGEERAKIEEEKEKIKAQHKGNRLELIKKMGKLKVEMNKEKSGKEVFLQNQVDMLEGDKVKMRAEIDKLKEEIDSKDDKIAEAEVQVDEQAEELQALREEIDRLRKQGEGTREELSNSLKRESEWLDNDGVEDGEENKLVSLLMEGFNKEREGMKAKNDELKTLLRQALVDVLYLNKCVAVLEGRGEG
ncbi:hypothetical protein TrVE_jg1056 [Triparma verrucosa]|uniref:Kinesin-like protein n=1 Tax=Triparma verrucosa TaxID=1606542 RepID=A0A9W7B403_9STRA|nr:hypothetical protein TrVE_jg1056 [Triparma verrucosa]